MDHAFGQETGESPVLPGSARDASPSRRHYTLLATLMARRYVRTKSIRLPTNSDGWIAVTRSVCKLFVSSRIYETLRVHGVSDGKVDLILNPVGIYTLAVSFGASSRLLNS